MAYLDLSSTLYRCAPVVVRFVIVFNPCLVECSVKWKLNGYVARRLMTRDQPVSFL